MQSLLELECKEQPAATEKKSSFRLSGKCFILTFPQCSESKEVALKRIQDHKWTKDLDFAIVSEEKHSSGDPHLHVVVKFEQQIRTSEPNFFDFICQKHGNYQASRSVTGSVQYVIKYGTYVTYNIDVDKFLQSSKKGNIGLTVANQVKEGKSLLEIDASNPGYFMTNKRKIEEYQAWFAKKSYKPAKSWTILDLMTLSGNNLKIAKWLNKNLFQQRPYGSKDLFIHGTTQLGKTSLILKLQTYCRIYLVPLNEDWYDLYNDEDYDVAVIDEFKGHKSIQFLNEWCQGAIMYVKRRGIAGYIKKKHMPTIIISNYSLSECYAKAVSEHSNCLEPLKRRLKSIEVTEPININF